MAGRSRVALVATKIERQCCPRIDSCSISEYRASTIIVLYSICYSTGIIYGSGTILDITPCHETALSGLASQRYYTFLNTILLLRRTNGCGSISVVNGCVKTTNIACSQSRRSEKHAQAADQSHYNRYVLFHPKVPLSRSAYSLFVYLKIQ